ncbi:MAG: beta-N-acetylhexosaminidase [Legionellales bacterium]|nr:beta-N-acetylhexosaminidase [Legionellales bacterium]
MSRLIIDLNGREIAADEYDLLRHEAIAGIILFSRNIDTPQQVQALTQHIRDINPDLFICVDQEGGRVQRLKHQFTPLPPLYYFGQHFRQQPQIALAELKMMATQLIAETLAVGIDFSFAPVLDLYRRDSSVIGDRAFASHPDEVIKLAEVFIDAAHQAGAVVCGKHFPGHGSVEADSHLTSVFDQREFAEIEQNDLKPFKALAAKLDLIMPAHVTYAKVDKLPAGFSPYWLQTVLRQQLEYSGLIVCDDLSMKAACNLGDIFTCLTLAFEAGCDLALICNDRPNVLAVLEKWSYPIDQTLNKKLLNLRHSKKYSWEELQHLPEWQVQAELIAKMKSGDVQ